MSTKIAAVIGNPISHSLSPILHNYLLQKYQIDGQYIAIKVTQDEFDEKIQQLLEDDNIVGFNITIPHKERIYDYFVKHELHISKEARAIKAVNTVYKKNGQYYAANSDIFGFEQNLLINSNNLSYNNALILGAGGAASAALYSLAHKFDNIYIYNRTAKRAQDLAANFAQLQLPAKITVINEPSPDILKNIDLIVNSTSIGMKNDLKHNFSLQDVQNSNCHCYDLIYNPLYTDLLKQAQSLNLTAITGIGMLIYQALLGFEQWFGQRPNLSKEEFNEISQLLIANLQIFTKKT